MEIRLIVDPALPGAHNMARDEALLKEGIPVLRFYAWNPPCVSVGYFQNIKEDIDLEYLNRHGIDLVRRPTGGRAVLHDKELTYALVLPESILPAGVVSSYKKIAQVFLATFTELELEPELRGPQGRADRAAVCFASTSAYEIAVAGKKILGSAQLRRDGWVLQHGSLLLSVDPAKHAACMRKKPDPADLQTKMAGLEELSDRKINTDELITLICNNLIRVFNVTLVPGH